MDLYSAFRSEDTEVLDAAQEDYVSLNRWVFKWRLKVRMFCTVECQQVESSRWTEQQQKKRDGPVRCVCEERPAAEHRKSAEPELVHGSLPAGLPYAERSMIC